MHVEVGPAIALALCLLSVPAGCQGKNRDRHNEIDEVRWTLAAPTSSDEQLWAAYERLLTLPPEENMNSWVRIVNDPARGPEQRLLAFHAFWGRAVAPGTTLQQLARRYAIGSWFTVETVKDEGGASQLPAVIEQYREQGWDRYGFLSLDLPGERPQLDPAPVYLVLSRSMTEQEVMLCVQRPEATQDVEILAVWVLGRDEAEADNGP